MVPSTAAQPARHARRAARVRLAQPDGQGGAARQPPRPARRGRPILPGVVGYDETVLPAVENAILAGQDLVFLGERGQAKTRMARLLVGLLDEWLPVVRGGELNDDPFAPISPAARAIVERARRRRRRSTGCRATAATPRSWPRPTSRSPTSSARWIPIRVAEGRYLVRRADDPLRPDPARQPRHLRDQRAARPRRADPGGPAQHPRGARRPDPRLLVRLPLDLFVVASANPEDYTSRGRIITPLKDRLGSQIRTHYPRTLDARDRDHPPGEAALRRPRTAPGGGGARRSWRSWSPS